MSPTPTQLRLLKVLGDGEPHLKAEVHACCVDCSEITMRVHLSMLRKKLRKNNPDVDIISVLGDRKSETTFRLIRYAKMTAKELNLI